MPKNKRKEVKVIIQSFPSYYFFFNKINALSAQEFIAKGAMAFPYLHTAVRVKTIFEEILSENS